jgi:hypothetical protein
MQKREQARVEDVPLGPYLAAAFFCERVIQDNEGVLTVVRIVDRVTSTATGVGTPDVMPPVSTSLTLVVMLKSGHARGRHDIEVRSEGPSGLRLPLQKGMSVQLDGEERGANLIIQANLTLENEGLYWFDVLLDGRALTRVPLRVVYQRLETGQAPQLPSGQ